MTVFYLEDFHPGDRFETEAITLTEEAMVAFAREFDPQPFHLDPVAAKKSLFKGLIPSGWHIGAISMRLVVRSGPNIANGWVGLGVEQIRWPIPARPGETLHVEIEVLEVIPSRSKPGWGVVKCLWRTLNQDGTVVQEAFPSCWVQARPELP
jgi:acyl dehydratase